MFELKPALPTVLWKKLRTEAAHEEVALQILGGDHDESLADLAQDWEQHKALCAVAVIAVLFDSLPATHPMKLTRLMPLAVGVAADKWRRTYPHGEQLDQLAKMLEALLPPQDITAA